MFYANNFFFHASRLRKSLQISCFLVNSAVQNFKYNVNYYHLPFKTLLLMSSLLNVFFPQVVLISVTPRILVALFSWVIHTWAIIIFWYMTWILGALLPRLLWKDVVWLGEALFLLWQKSQCPYYKNHRMLQHFTKQRNSNEKFI